ncbi:MAG: 3-deoxy-D-manno-octulosonic acid transferase [Burkholderiaceae bacterium]
MSKLVLSLYSAAVWCVQPFLRLKLARRGRAEPGYLVNIDERFGLYQQPAVQSLPKNQQFVWIHAVSLGETRAAAVLVAALRQHLPDMKLLLTHGTATGRAEGVKLLRAGDVQVWQAWDTKAVTDRFIQHFQPRMGIMMETELWPNMAATCAKLKIPMAIANARMSEKTYRLTRKFDGLARPAYQSLAAVWPQSAADAERFAKLGASVAGIFGNLKFDAVVDENQLEKGKNWRSNMRRPVVMFASSREGEELALLQYLQKTAFDVQWLIVPRHPQRFVDVAALITQHGFNVSKRSDWLDQPDIEDANTIMLGNSLGEMAFYYGMSDAALLGGSFEPLGGQNLIEAAACGCPVVMGPSVFNFSEAAALAMESGAAFSVDSMPQAVDTVSKMVDNRAAVDVARAAALQFAKSHQGAAEKTAAAVVTFLR